MMQEYITFGIVGLTFSYLIYRFFLSVGAQPVSNWLLKRGQVKWAMWIRSRWVKNGRCTNC